MSTMEHGAEGVNGESLPIFEDGLTNRYRRAFLAEVSFLALLLIIILVQYLQGFVFNSLADLPLNAGMVKAFMLVNVLMAVLMTGFILVNFLVARCCKERQPQVFWITGHLMALSTTVFALFHIHLDGSQTVFLIMLLPGFAFFYQQIYSFRFGWFYMTVGLAGWVVVAFLEARGILAYAPLLAYGGELGKHVFQSHYFLSNNLVFLLIALVMGFVAFLFDRDARRRRRALITAYCDLKNSRAEIRKLRGLLPICSICHKVRQDDGYWADVTEYLNQQTEMRVSHGICPDCLKTQYPDIYKKLQESGEIGLPD